MQKAKIDKFGLCATICWLAVLGALYYFGYTTAWGAQLLQAFELLLLFWSVLSSLYLLIRMGVTYLQSRRAARLGLTLAQYKAQQRIQRGDPSLEETAARRRDQVASWKLHLLHIARWELALFAALLILFGVLAQHWRHDPDSGKLSALGLLYSLLLYTFLGLQVLHRLWARWHHRLAPGSLAPAAPTAGGKLTTSQLLWNTCFCLALLFAVTELLRSGGAEAAAVIVAMATPAFVLLLIAGLWRMLRPLFRHRHGETA